MRTKALVAEFVGTFTLIFVGVMAIAMDHMTKSVGLVGIALAHGLAIAVMVSATAAISGGHLNPAVTIGALVGRKIDLLNAIGYIVAQCVGALAAALLVLQCLPAEVLKAISMGTPQLNTAAGVTIQSGLIIEAVLTFFLVFVVFGTGIDKRGPKVGGLFIGLTVALDILAGGPLTGGAMNPARHLGPALVGNYLDHFWVYWVGPVAGGIVAGLLYHQVLDEKKSA
ncbi:MAG: aquaporin [Phycisphaeraceae bacterium]|nr:aquaporin [Phycisphaeraceae bacterium]